MNIAIGKLGKSILFNPEKWGAIGGDSEAPVIFENLFHYNPDHNFYLIGHNDFRTLSSSERLKLNKHNNVIDVWSQYPDWSKSFTGNHKYKCLDYLRNYVKEHKLDLDVGLFLAGPVGHSNVIGKSRMSTNPSEFSTPLDWATKYAAPLIDYLNDSNLPWNVIINDPRYFPGPVRDLFNPPKMGLSQYNETIYMKRWKSYDDLTVIKEKVPSNYIAAETIFLINKSKGDYSQGTNTLDSFFGDEEESSDKDINFMIVCNEGRPSRYPDLKKYILDRIEDIDIYGQWDARTIGDDPRFKGPRKFMELQKMLPRVKYTFCIPIKKGWVTAKFWEMAHYGIIPFLHPDYDSQDNLKCPEFLRVKNADDLFKKITHLEKYPEHYELLKDKLSEMIDDKFYNGSHLNSVIMNSLNEIKK